MFRNGIYTLLVLASLFTASVAEAQTRLPSRSAIDSLRNMLQMQPDASIIRLERNTVDFGVLYDTVAPYSAELKFCNVSGRELRIDRVQANCGCIGVEYEKSLLADGEEGIIRMSFNPKGQAGTIDKRIFVYTSLSQSTPATCVILKGNVVGCDEWDFLPHRVGTLRLKTKEVVFENVQKSQKPSMRIMCANVGVEPLRLASEIIAPYVAFDVEPCIIEPGFIGDIVISVDGAKLPEFVDEHTTAIIFGGVQGAPSARTIKVIVKKDNN